MIKVLASPDVPAPAAQVCRHKLACPHAGSLQALPHANDARACRRAVLPVN